MKPLTEREWAYLQAARARYDDAWMAEYIRGAVDMNGPLQLPLEVAEGRLPSSAM